MMRSRSRTWLVGTAVVWLLAIVMAITHTTYGKQIKQEKKKKARPDIFANAAEKITRGQEAFRFDTFGDQAFWGGTLGLHEAIEGAAHGGVGPGVSPKTALAVGLKVDIDALPRNVIEEIVKGRINLNDPAVTLALLKFKAVVGVTGIFPATGCSPSGFSARSVTPPSTIPLHRCASARSGRIQAAVASAIGWTGGPIAT